MHVPFLYIASYYMFLIRPPLFGMKELFFCFLCFLYRNKLIYMKFLCLKRVLKPCLVPKNFAKFFRFPVTSNL